MLHMSLITFPLLFILISGISLCFPGQLDSLTHDENKYCMWETLSCHLGREEQRGERVVLGGVCAVFATAASPLCLILSQLSHLDAPSAPAHHHHLHRRSYLQLLTLTPPSPRPLSLSFSLYLPLSLLLSLGQSPWVNDSTGDPMRRVYFGWRRANSPWLQSKCARRLTLREESADSARALWLWTPTCVGAGGLHLPRANVQQK